MTNPPLQILTAEKDNHPIRIQDSGIIPITSVIEFKVDGL